VDVFVALADPVRRELLQLLRRCPSSAGELADRFDITRPAISRHLRVLREADLVTVREQGRHRLYRLEPGPLAELDVWLDDFRDRWSPRLDALATEVQRTRRERRQPPPGAGANDTQEESA